MALLLPGERRSPVWGALLAATAVLGLCALGCATSASSRQVRARPDEGAAMVERALHRDGLRFGTDGSTRALWEYMSLSHRQVTARNARPGDVLFFATGDAPDAQSCQEPDHAGIVAGVEPEGRITFVEARGGRIHTSFVDPAHPVQRRNGRGEIANTFLRAKAVDDPPDARYFAGQMLCGVARPERR